MSNGPSPEPPQAPRPADRGRRALAGGDAKRRYLRAAADLAGHDHTGRDHFAYAVSRVSLADVAADLGVARTTLYKWWPSKVDFWADLTAYLAATDQGPTAADIGASILSASTPRAALEQARLALNALQTARLLSPWVALRTALLGYAGDARLDGLIAAANRRDVDAITTQVERTLAAAGLVPREPLTAHDIAVAAYCVADGLATAGRLSPQLNAHDITVDREAGGWGLLAFSTLGILRRCARERTAADADSPATTHATAPTLPSDPSGPWSEPQRAALDVGARRFVSRSPSRHSMRRPGPLGQITIARLARHAGVSRQSLHRIWPSQQAFSTDLITYVFGERCEQELAMLCEANRRSTKGAAAGPLVAAETATRRLISDAARGPLVHLTWAAHEDDPLLVERCREALESMLGRFSADLETTSRSWGGSLRDGVESAHLASIIVLTELAAARLERTNPGSVRVGLAHRGGRWSALAIILEGIVGYTLQLPARSSADNDR